MSYLRGFKVLGRDEWWIYSESHEQYFSEFDTMVEYIEDNEDREIGEVFTIKTKKCFQLQYWFPDVDYIKEFHKENLRFPVLNEVLIKMMEMTNDESFFSEESEEIEIKPDELKAVDKLEKAFLNYIKYKNDKILKQDLDEFQKANEDLMFYYVDNKSETEKHQFSFIEDEKGELKLKYIGKE